MLTREDTDFFFIPLPGLNLMAKRIDPDGTSRSDMPVMVFLHEGLGSIAQWRDFPEKLVALTGCPGLIFDRYGYGGSDPDPDPWPMDYLLTEAGERLPAILQQCRIRQAILIGHSDGGTIALLTSALNPSMIKGAVVEAAHIFVEEITTAGIRKAVESYRTGNLRVALKKYHHDQVDRIFFRWADRWLSGEFKSWSIIDWLPSITCPLLVIQGARDEYGTPAQVDGIARHVSGPVATRLIPGCGHVPHFQAEKTVLKETARFIEALLHDEGHVFS